MKRHALWMTLIGATLWSVGPGCDSDDTTSPPTTGLGGHAAAAGAAGHAGQGGGSCGDGAVEGTEQCDEGNDNSDSMPDACRTDCTLPSCSDGVTDPGYGEACDDGNTASDDGCSADCREYRSITSLGISAIAYDLARDNDDRVHILWKDGNALSYGLIVDGAVPAPESIPDSGGVHTRFTRPRLAVSPDGTQAAACWINDGGNFGTELHCAAPNASGVLATELVWSAGASGYKVAQPALAIDATGAVHLIAQHYLAPNADYSVAYWLRPPSGPWPSTEERLYDEGGDEWRGNTMCSDRDGGVHAVWKCSPSRPGKYSYAPSGGTLVGADVLDIGQTHVSLGESAVSDGGDVHHAYVNWPDWAIRYASKTASADSFSDTVQIASMVGATNWDPWPDIGLDQHDRIFVVWGENLISGDVTQVGLAMHVDGAWSTEVLADDAAIDPFSRPALAVTRTAAHVVWRGSNGELVLAVLAYAP